MAAATYAAVFAVVWYSIIILITSIGAVTM